MRGHRLDVCSHNRSTPNRPAYTVHEFSMSNSVRSGANPGKIKTSVLGEIRSRDADSDENTGTLQLRDGGVR